MTAPAETAIAVARQSGGGSISAFADASTFEAAQRMAKALAASSLVPEAYQKNLPNVLIAMEAAARIGASVFAVMQNMDIIHGRPSWRATFLIATVNASGRFSPLRFRWEGESGKQTWGCRAYATDKSTGDECLGALITLGLAHVEGWAKKPGSKWATIPEQMLMYRAASFWARVYAPELSLGMSTREELEDIGRVVLPADIAPGDTSELEDALRADTTGAAHAAPSAPAHDPITGEVREPGDDG